ncbi:MAG: helix-turn-helix domain-containing protein [Robiginitomaculum sp.]|nr:helix-turn-helix domain-containing protein [Robiginitomaculum sp.]
MRNYTAIQTAEFARVFDAFGHPRRIAIYLALKAEGASGLTFGVLAKQANIADPSLTHHIRMMKKSGLVKSKIEGQFTVLTLNLSAMKHACKQLGLT